MNLAGRVQPVRSEETTDTPPAWPLSPRCSVSVAGWGRATNFDEAVLNHWLNLSGPLRSRAEILRTKNTRPHSGVLFPSHCELNQSGGVFEIPCHGGPVGRSRSLDRERISVGGLERRESIRCKWQRQTAYEGFRGSRPVALEGRGRHPYPPRRK